MTEKLFKELSELKFSAPKLFGIPTGTRLNEMFWSISEEKGSFIKKPIGGLPYLSIINYKNLT